MAEFSSFYLTKSLFVKLIRNKCFTGSTQTTYGLCFIKTTWVTANLATIHLGFFQVCPSLRRRCFTLLSRHLQREELRQKSIEFTLFGKHISNILYKLSWTVGGRGEQRRREEKKHQLVVCKSHKGDLMHTVVFQMRCSDGASGHIQTLDLDRGTLSIRWARALSSMTACAVSASPEAMASAIVR